MHFLSFTIEVPLLLFIACLLEPRCPWKMVFKAMAATGNNVLNAFKNGGNINRRLSGEMSIANNLEYRDGSVLDNWNSLPIREVSRVIFIGVD